MHKFLIVGLGSMGKRRIRSLQALGYDIAGGFDLRTDRLSEVKKEYGIHTFSDFSVALKETQPTSLIIAVPPDVHHIYMKAAIESEINFFVEASVLDDGMLELIEGLSQKSHIIAAPSCTLLFHPAVKIIQSILNEGYLGNLSSLTYHSGQYLPDWHTYESVKDYYVSNRSTGGAREIVPFELTWLTHVFGLPKQVCGFNRKTITIQGAEEIDDTYHCLLDYGNFLATLNVDVVSRFATRRLVINGDRKQLIWDWNSHVVKIYDPLCNKWEEIDYYMGEAANGYNSNIGEIMYLEELKSFIEAVEGKQAFINTLEKDLIVLQILYALEKSDKTLSVVRIGA